MSVVDDGDRGRATDPPSFVPLHSKDDPVAVAAAVVISHARLTVVPDDFR
ncbi:hypothetical protein [Streptomyces sp. NRRL B-24720]|nr:hypothetical protein [Streptomyces sp. NRRL B-24720]